MNKELVVNVTNEGIIVALLEDKRLVEINRDKINSNFKVGDLYFGKVAKLMPGLNAAFIDIGYEKDAFLHYLDLSPQVKSLLNFTKQIQSGKLQPNQLDNFKLEEDITKDGKISDVLSSGQTIIVQVAKEPISTKGPKLTCELSFPGRYIVLVPFSDKVSISQKIKNPSERDRLRNLAKPLLPKNFGIIIRTVAEGKSGEEFVQDIQDQMDRWNKCFENVKRSTPPARVHGEINRTSVILRDIFSDSFSNIHVNNEESYNQLKEFVEQISPGKEKIVKHYKGKADIFDNFNVTKQIKNLFGRNVPLESGAYLIIEHTEAMHVIDVNTGPRQNASGQEFSALDTNLDAAKEIARQMRLRDLGGIIVVDFIDMPSQENRDKLFELLKEEMKEDRAKHTLLPPSKFGLVEITRQRVRPQIQVTTSEKCPSCKGSGEIQASITILNEIENNLRYILNEQNERKLVLVVHPFLYSYLKKGFIFNTIQWKWYVKYKKWIEIRQNQNHHLLQYSFLNRFEEEITL